MPDRQRTSVNQIAPPPARPAPARLSLRAAADIARTLVQTALLVVIFTALVGRFEIHQTSMEPNFHEGQRVMVSQIGAALPPALADRAHAAGAQAPFDLRRGQVAVFFEDAARGGDALIKRVVGLPGDRVVITEGYVSVNGAPLDEPYAPGVYTDCSVFCDVTLGPGQYYFMGDNRAVSRDSRSFGPIPAEQVVGRVIARFWPLDTLALYP
jgi:signal peptidase I